jgi:ribosomal protein S18 acetylase RimI-like enzyme
MAAYRFCRTDDIALLVDALNRCWSPAFPDEPPMTPAAFKRSIRDLQVWCSSCMVAFSGSDPIAVLIGAKRPPGTLIHKIAVHPDHRRQGHGRHLLASLGSKLAILGPPRIVVEVPETLTAACGLFSASGYVEEALLTDYVLRCEQDEHAALPGAGAAAAARGQPDAGERRCDDRDQSFVAQGFSPADGRFVIPVTVDDLAANDLLGEGHPHACWARSIETLTARKDDIAGLAVASDERIEAYVLFVRREMGPEEHAAQDRGAGGQTAEIVLLRTYIEDGGARLQELFSGLRARGLGTLWFPKVHPAEISKGLLETLGLRPAGRHRLYAARAKAE